MGRRRDTDWLFFFPPDQQITTERLMLECFFHYSSYFPGAIPPFLSRDLVGFWAWAARAPREGKSQGRRRDPPGTPQVPLKSNKILGDQQITTEKLMLECYFSSFVILSRDLKSNLSVVIWSVLGTPKIKQFSGGSTNHA